MQPSGITHPYPFGVFMNCFVHQLGTHTSLLLQKYKEELMQDWDKNQLDAVICPGIAYPATKPGHLDELFSNFQIIKDNRLFNFHIDSD